MKTTLDSRQLLAFAALARRGSFTLAASAVFRHPTGPLPVLRNRSCLSQSNSTAANCRRRRCGEDVLVRSAAVRMSVS